MKSCTRVFFTSRPEHVRIGILDFGLLAVDGVFIGLDLARVCGVPGVWSFCEEPVWIRGRQVFSVGQDFASVEAWDTGSGHYDVVRYTKHTTESFKGLVETLLKQFTAD